MKHIHFNKNNWFWVTLLVLSLVCILAGTFEFYEFENPGINRKIAAAGFLLQVIYFFRFFIYKNDVQVTKNIIMIRLNSWNGKRIYFDHIASTILTESSLIVTKTNGEHITFDAKGIHPDDLQKLNELLLSKLESPINIG
ncbi:hypothetical protein [uncultured Dokdonia sp.]|uniref:hypothetical protein n=1 Tax=uncultured Dokdonia sp. TaxID=575653 RepID=UPI00260501D8|nr:hypothetical protein [uncultured Dokdonia sp.]